MCEKIKCPKCSGTGHIPQYNHVEDGICFDCSGSGWIDKKEYEHMIEQQATRDIKKISKQTTNRKQAINFFQDTLYLVIGNTYSIKDELKAQGAKWNVYLHGWVLPEPNTKYKTVTIHFDDVKDLSVIEAEALVKKLINELE